MYTDFYSFHSDVSFSVRDTCSNMLKFRFEFTFTYKSLTYSSFCKSWSSVDSGDSVEFPYMMRKRSANRSFTYRLVLNHKVFVFTLNQEYDSCFNNFLRQFPVCIDLD